MKMKVFMVGMLFTFVLTACGLGENENHQKMGHNSEDMIHNGSPEVPEALEVAINPKYPLGSTAFSKADHMGGMMENVEVTITGAFDTTAYATSYISSTTKERVKEHKWIVHEEIVDARETPYEKGEVVFTTAQHMKGMNDTEHTIDFSVKTIVYMVDFVSTDGQKVTNHKWVTEEELVPIEKSN